MLTPYKDKERPALVPKALFHTTCGRSSDLLLSVCRLPIVDERRFDSGRMTDFCKSLQQRELYGILTRFPIEPFGTAYRRQK